jgi:hypothetical protein
MGVAWEPDGNILKAIGAVWEMHASYFGHMGALCTIWELVVPYGSQIKEADGTLRVPDAPNGSCVGYGRHV